MRALAVLLIACSGFSLNAAYADDLQITDYYGLIRAQRDIRNKATVKITVRRSETEPLDIGFGNPLLVQRAGVSPNIEAVEVAPSVYEFSGVATGVWRIRLRNKGLLLDSVEIIDHVR